MSQFLARFLRAESGAAAIEYGLVAALIAIVIISGAAALGLAINNQLNSTSNTVAAAGS